MADKLTITLTGRPPVTVTKDRWPILASGTWHDGRQVECQANRRSRLIVRQSEIGIRHGTIVYGVYTTQWQGESDRRAGVYLDDPETTIEQIVDAIREVGEYLDFSRELIDECIANLPAVDLG